MSRGDLTLDIEVVPGEITADDVLREFLLTMHEWAFRPFRYPADFPPEEQVTLPEADVLAERAGQAGLLVEACAAGRI